MQRVLCGFLLLCLVIAGAAPVRAGAGLPCVLPPELTSPNGPLTHVAAALTTGRLDILAIGSGSTVGDAGRSGGTAQADRGPQPSFPYRMIETLQAMRPGARFQLTVRGGRDMTSNSMLPILRQELASRHYNLVLWQTGTVEAVHGLRPDSLRAVLQDGADAAAKASADLVLIDPQFSRFLRANTDISPYETILEQMTGTPGVTLFRRFDLTRLWVTSGQIDLERTGRDQRDKTIVLLNSCLGEALARYLLAGAGDR
jgi:acyl-CoA thioesterase I